MKKSFVLASALVMTLSTITPTLAATKEVKSNSKEISQLNHQENQLNLSEFEIEKYGKYVELDNNNYFIINSEGQKELSKEEYKKLMDVLSNTNANMDYVIANSATEEALDIEIASPTDNQESIMLLASYKEGVSKVTFHWWGVKIYLSKTHANKALKAGITLGGIWIGSKVLSSVGVMLGLTNKGFFKGGIWIKQYWVAGVGPIKTLFGFNTAGYQ